VVVEELAVLVVAVMVVVASRLVVGSPWPPPHAVMAMRAVAATRKAGRVFINGR
jgi:hypothetical protein